MKVASTTGADSDVLFKDSEIAEDLKIKKTLSNCESLLQDNMAIGMEPSNCVHDELSLCLKLQSNSLKSTGSISNLNQSVHESEEEDGDKQNKYKKDKSLGILCQ